MLLAALLVAGGAYLLLSNDSAKKALHVSSATSEAGSSPVGSWATTPRDDGSEHGVAARLRDRSQPATAWDTEATAIQEGRRGTRPQAPRAVALRKMTVNSIGSDFDAEIKAGDSSTGPFTDVSGDFQPVGQRRIFSVDTHGRKYRYYVVWLKLPFEGGRAQISEVTART